MNARDCNTLPRTVVALVLGLVLIAGSVGCGGSGTPSAQTIVNDTFHSHRQIDSGQLGLSFSLSASGLPSLSTPVSLRVNGPFQSVGSGRLPHFDLNVALATGGHTLKAGAVSVANNFFVRLEGTAFQMPQSTLTALQQGYAQSSEKATASAKRSSFASLGVNPGSWLEHPVKAANATVGGAHTIHLVAGLNLTRFLADAARLSGAGGTLGLSSSQSGLLSTQQTLALARSLTSARVDLYTGAEDHLLRSLSVHAVLSTSPQARQELGGLRTATLDLHLQFAGLNQPQTITTPTNPHPVSQLIALLRQLGLIAAPTSSTGQTQEEQQPSGSGETPSSSTGESTTTNPSGGSSKSPASQTYMSCIHSAGGSVSALQKCATLLGR